MSQPVEIGRIKQFMKDRNRLPYDDNVVAKRMGVDRSNYSKAVNLGPITNAFLRKFYLAFGDELGEKKEVNSSQGKDEIIKQLEKIEKHLCHLVAISNQLLQRMEHLTKELTGLVNNRF